MLNTAEIGEWGVIAGDRESGDIVIIVRHDGDGGETVVTIRRWERRKLRAKTGVGKRLVSVWVVSQRCDGDWGGDERRSSGGNSQATNCLISEKMSEQEKERGMWVFR